MTQVQPAFWAKYRGEVDPQRPNITPYAYTATMYTKNNPEVQLFSGEYTVYGPPQLNKRDYIEVRWSPAVGLTRIVITRNSVDFYQTNGAEQGFRDEGQYNVVNGGVQNQ